MGCPGIENHRHRFTTQADVQRHVVILNIDRDAAYFTNCRFWRLDFRLLNLRRLNLLNLRLWSSRNCDRSRCRHDDDYWLWLLWSRSGVRRWWVGYWMGGYAGVYRYGGVD